MKAASRSWQIRAPMARAGYARAGIPFVRPATASRRSAGFTLVELLVSIVIGTILIGAIYQVLVTNQRIAAVQREHVIGQQTVRAGIDLLVQELREVSPGGGDLTSIEDDRVAFRALRAFGIACQVTNSVPPVLRIANEGRLFAVGDSVYVFADGNPAVAADDQWFSVAVTAVTNGDVCGTDEVPAQTITLSGPGTQANSDLILPGAIVRGWEGIAYGLGEVGGVPFLVRELDGETVRLVGPLREGNGVTFRYLDSSGTATNNAANVARIEVTMRILSEARTEAGQQVTDSLTTSVFLRN